MRAAIIDLGTNTFKLLVAERPEGTHTGLQILHSEEVGVFLGRGGVERNVLTDEAMERGMATLRVLMGKAHDLKAVKVQGFGTSALRNAKNGKEFTARVKDELGLEVTIIPGDDEAGYILDGVRQVVPMGHKPMLLMDIGGGSTEFILATEKTMLWKHSFELGTTRLLERFPDMDPMGSATRLRMAQHIDAHFGMLWGMMERHAPTVLVGSAGSFDTIARMMALEQGSSIADDQPTAAFTPDQFDRLKELILHMTREQRKADPGLPAHRTDTIVPALMLIERVLYHGIREIHWSRYSLKEGAAARMLG